MEARSCYERLIIIYTQKPRSGRIYKYDYGFTPYLLTPWSRVLLEKLTVNFAASQKIPRIHGTRKFLTVPTSARHLFYGCVILPLETLPPEAEVADGGTASYMEGSCE
jgi:hypothetical protein